MKKCWQPKLERLSFSEAFEQLNAYHMELVYLENGLATFDSAVVCAQGQSKKSRTPMIKGFKAVNPIARCNHK